MRITRRTRRDAVFPGSSAVEHSTVNRQVAGSNPARGAKFKESPVLVDIHENRAFLFHILFHYIFCVVAVHG